MSGGGTVCGQKFAKTLLQIEVGRGANKETAWNRVADKLHKVGIGAGTFEGIVKGRVKSVAAHVRDRLQSLLERELEAEIKRLTHELEMVKEGGRVLADEQVDQIQAHLAAARALLKSRPS